MPYSTDFENGTNGAGVTYANSIFDGVDGFDQTDPQGTDGGVVFTNNEAHSGQLSITGNGTTGYPTRQLRYVGVVDTTNETISFWHKYVLVDASSSGYLYAMRGGPIGLLRKDYWSDAIQIEYGLNSYTISFRTDAGGWTTHAIPGVPEGWVRVEASYDHPSRTYSVKITNGGSVVYADVSQYISNLRYGGTSGNYGFAHHNFFFNGFRTQYDGRTFIDDINYDAAPAITGKVGNVRRHFT